jgi:hypothetical protein
LRVARIHKWKSTPKVSPSRSVAEYGEAAARAELRLCVSRNGLS